MVYINDYALMRELHGVPLPVPRDTLRTLLGYALALCPLGECQMTQGPFISGFNEFVNTTTGLFHDSLAFDLRNVDQSVLAGAEPGMLEVVRGRFDPEATDQALRACVECPQPTLAELSGVTYYSWGEDLAMNLQTRLTPPCIRRIWERRTHRGPG